MSIRKKKTKKTIEPLPKYIRDELRMTVAMKGYSDMKCGKSKRLPDQYIHMYDYFHGKRPNHPPQISLLAEAHMNYNELYDYDNCNATNKNDDSDDIKKTWLKSSLTRDSSRLYYSSTDIRASDLEKKNRTGNMLITGRNLHDMAIRGVRNYKKALAFCLKRWDEKLMQPKLSGHTIEDVIEFVRYEMYKLLKGKIETNDDASRSDSEGEEVVDETTSGTRDKESNPDNEETGLENEETVGNETTMDDDDSEASDDSVMVPDKYMFPSYFIFLTYGPSALPNNRLAITLAKDDNKSKAVTRKELRKNEANKKLNDAMNDSTNQRVFSTDQRIEIENMFVSNICLIGRDNHL